LIKNYYGYDITIGTEVYSIQLGGHCIITNIDDKYISVKSTYNDIIEYRYLHNGLYEYDENKSIGNKYQSLYPIRPLSINFLI
jgi:hypothetical protein